MDNTSDNPLVHPLSDRRMAALATLLCDDDPAVSLVAKTEILTHGLAAKEWLDRCRLSQDPTLRKRSTAIIRDLGELEADREFFKFCLRKGEDLDLEMGCWLLSRTRYPEVNIVGYKALLDEFSQRLREALKGASKPEEVLGRINRLLFGELGFLGDDKDYYGARNSYLTRVIDRRRGNPISLCVLVLLLSRRLQLPIVGIGLPGHFLCRMQTATGDIYMDAFHQGRLLHKADCVKYLRQAGYEFHDAFLMPASPRRILLRMCSNLHQIYLRRGDDQRAGRVKSYIVALSR